MAIQDTDKIPVQRGDTVYYAPATFISDYIVASVPEEGTDLSYVADPAYGLVVSSSGTDATIPLATGTNAGLLAPAEKTKLSSIDPADYAAASHTHSIANVTGLQGELDDLVPRTRVIATGTGLTGGGNLTADKTFNLTDTAVTVGSYGSASEAAIFTVDQQGRLTSASETNIAIAASAVTSGTFADARVSETSVTQHEAALSVLASQISDSDTFGRTLLAAATAAAGRTDLGLGTAAVEDITDASNSNGDYVQIGPFLVCWHTIALGSILAGGSGTDASPYRTDAATWTFPQSFSATPFFSISFTPDSAIAIDARPMVAGPTSVGTASLFNIRAHRQSSSNAATDVTAHVFAIGLA